MLTRLLNILKRQNVSCFLLIVGSNLWHSSIKTKSSSWFRIMLAYFQMLM